MTQLGSTTPARRTPRLPDTKKPSVSPASSDGGDRASEACSKPYRLGPQRHLNGRQLRRGRLARLEHCSGLDRSVQLVRFHGGDRTRQLHVSRWQGAAHAIRGCGGQCAWSHRSGAPWSGHGKPCRFRGPFAAGAGSTCARLAWPSSARGGCLPCPVRSGRVGCPHRLGAGGICEGPVGGRDRASAAPSGLGPRLTMRATKAGMN